MPVKVVDRLPAVAALEKENIFVMTPQRAETQDIRPLKLAILNLMPTKEVTETQLLRLISNSPLQVEVVFLHTESYISKNTQRSHLEQFYTTFSEVENCKFDGLVVTGAPVENLEYREVKYWDELTRIFDWAEDNVFSTMYICWASQAALYYQYGIKKYQLEKKVSGIYKHKLLNKNNPIVRGFDDEFLAPHSRYTEIRREDIEKIDELELLAYSELAGVYLVASKDLRHLYVTGHSEYDADTLHLEYTRDLAKGLEIDEPYNYYEKGQIGQIPPMKWRSHSMLLFNNWLNYAVYQQTPYNIKEITSSKIKK